MSDANTPFNPGLSFAGAVDLEAVKHRVEAKEGEPLGAPAASGWVVDTTEALFESVIRSSSQYPVLLTIAVSELRGFWARQSTLLKEGYCFRASILKNLLRLLRL